MASAGHRVTEPNFDPTVRAILQAFNTWAFKREQPSDSALLARHVGAAVARHSPVPFVLYWGKGPRSNVTTPELRCLSFLTSMSERIASVYAPAAHFTLVCTDTHALHNGHSPEAIQQYFSELSRAASQSTFSCCRLGSLSPMSALVAMEEHETEIPAASLQRLIAAASKWYRGGESAERGAIRYYRMNMAEKQAIEHAFPDGIFVTFNGSDYRMLFPDNLPIFYMYSVKRGVAVKPWFMDPSDMEPQRAESATFATVA